MQKTVDIAQKEKLIKVLRENHITYAALFGSRAKGEARPDSDYDLLVEFDPKEQVGFFEFSKIERNIERALKTPVDLITTHGSNKRLHEEIDKTRVVLYDQRQKNG